MKLLVIFASLFALGSMTPEQDLVSIEEEPYGEDKGKLKEGKPEANNPVKGNEANPKENTEEELYGEGKGKLKEGNPEANNPGKGNEEKPKMRMQYGQFHELKFGVKGSVWSDDEPVLRIKGFHYDGKGTYTAEVFGFLRY